MPNLSQLSDQQLDALIQAKSQPTNGPADLSSLSDEQLDNLIAAKTPKKTSTGEEIARPFLRAGKSILAGTVGGAADLASLAVEAPIYAGYRITQAITGDKTPYKPIFADKSVTNAINEGFDKATGGLTANRNKGEQLLEIPQELLGGIIGPGAISRTSKAVVDLASRGGKKLVQKVAGMTPKSQETLKAFQDAGINPTLANISEGGTSKTFQNLLGNFPGSRSVIEKATQDQVDNIAKQLAGVTRSKGGTIQEAGKKIQEGAKNVKQILEDRITKNYDDLDQFVLSESQRTTGPKLMNAIDEWTKLKELESHLIGSVELNARSAGINTQFAQKQSGFWKNRTLSDSGKLLTIAGDDAKGLANIRKQITSQENVIGHFEKYMSPEQFQSALMAGEQKIPTKNLSSLVKDSQIQDVMAVGAGDTSKVMSRYSQIVDESGNVSYPRLKSFRSTVGAKLQSPSLMGDERSALKRIYGALSEDMKSAIKENGGERGLQAFNKANNAFGRYQEILESKINPLIDAKTPEIVYSMAMSGSKQGGTNIRGIMRTLDPEQKEFIRGTVVSQMGLMNTGMQDATGAAFSPSKFLTEWGKIDNKLNREAAENLFTRPQIESIRNLNKVIDSLKKVSKAGQSSNNLPYAAWAGLGGVTVANPAAAIGAVAGARITAKMMTNSKFVNWLAQTPKVKPTQIPQHLKVLSIIASQNPDLRQDILDYMESITSAPKEQQLQDQDQTEEDLMKAYNQESQKYPGIFSNSNPAEERKMLEKRYYRG